MTARSISLLVLGTLVCCIAASKIPTGIIPCSRNDPDLNACALRSAQLAVPYMAKGNPALGLAPMDPLHISELRIDDQGNARQINVDVIIRPLDVTGLRDVKIKDFKVDLKTGELQFSGVIPRLELIGHYSGSGRIIFLPIRGSGHMNVTLEDADFVYSFRLERARDRRTRTGQAMFVTPVDSAGECHPRNVIIKLNNMFNGDKRLEDHMNNFLTDNWRELESEMGPTLTEVFTMAFDQLISRITQLVPFDQLFPESITTPSPSTTSSTLEDKKLVGW